MREVPLRLRWLLAGSYGLMVGAAVFVIASLFFPTPDLDNRSVHAVLTVIILVVGPVCIFAYRKAYPDTRTLFERLKGL